MTSARRSERVADELSSIADPSLDSLDEAKRRELADVWAMRAGMELHVGAGFAVIVRELFETGADPAVLSLCARAVDDEIEHARICLALARRHDGIERPWPAPEPLSIPRHDGVSARALATLHLVAMSCLNETIASVRLGAALADNRSAAVDRALRAILADEVEHARAGWAHLASRFVGEEERREVTKWLPSMIEASLRGLVEENASLPESGHPEWGLPSVGATREVARAALGEVVLPGFRRVGITLPDGVSAD